MIPDASVTSDNVQLDDMEFSSTQKLGHAHEGVGSGTITLLFITVIKFTYRIHSNKRPCPNKHPS